MNKILIAICALILTTLNVAGQTGKVNVHSDPLFDTLTAQYKYLQDLQMEDPNNKGIEGYRVQIFFDSGTNSGNRAEDAKKSFEEEYEGVPAYITWRAPNYRVRVGDFRSRLEAEKFLARISRDYPNAWVIKDEINYPPLNPENGL